MEIRRRRENGRRCKAWFSWKTGAHWNIWNGSYSSGSAHYTGHNCILPV